ncbi:MAG: hypothetical protein R6W77_06200 [Trueperaceae bacterium]
MRRSSFPRRSLLALAIALPLVFANTASAQVCVQELRTSLSDLSLERPATGIDAALLLRRAVELVEPALPRLIANPTVALDPGHPDYGAVLYLAERKLLPARWQPGQLDGATWATMLDRFLTWYRLDASRVEAPATVSDAIDDLAAVLQRVSRTIRPAALLATDPADRNRMSFWAIIWNWTIYPRLLVIRPNGEMEEAQPRDALLAMSNCAVQLHHYVTAPEETAKRLFLTHNTSRMYVVSSRPGREDAWPFEVPEGEELAAFGFEMTELRGVQLYAAVFDGPEVGVGTLLGLITRVRTNMSPTTLLGYLRTP